ncbi:MAG: OstA family protein [Mesotoga sp.]|jgi:lipopolysaccharide export system protein LptA|nr:OstA family protein [Mesotoga sp.]NLI05507.1 OstA family protein [Thermotogaceae bacterium]HNS68212.1 OstA family protein [Mesotoga infera]HON28787.1 OstA family protein [Mesotoga infera]
MRRKLPIFLIVTLVFAVILIAQSTVRIKANELLATERQEVFTFKGNVMINKDGDIYVETPLATVTKGATDWQSFITEGETFVIFQTGEATTLSLDYNLDSSTGLMKDVPVAMIYSKEEGQKDIYIYKTDVLKFDQKNEYYEGFAKETADATPELIFIDYKGDLKVDTLYFEYHGETGMLNLKGNVFVNDEKNRRKIWASELLYNTQDDSFKGLNVEIELVF